MAPRLYSRPMVGAAVSGMTGWWRCARPSGVRGGINCLMAGNGAGSGVRSTSPTVRREPRPGSQFPGSGAADGPVSAAITITICPLAATKMNRSLSPSVSECPVPPAVSLLPNAEYSLVCGPAGSRDTSADSLLRRAGHFPKLAREQPLTANWDLHLYAGPSYLSRAATPSGQALSAMPPRRQARPAAGLADR